MLLIPNTDGGHYIHSELAGWSSLKAFLIKEYRKYNYRFIILYFKRLL